MFNTQSEKLDYEPFSVDYTQKHKYTPDSIVPGANLLVELKGSFEKNETAKYQAIHEQTGYAFLFVFQRRGTEIAWKNRKSMEAELLTKGGLHTTATNASIAYLFTVLLKMSLKSSKK